MHLRNLDQYPDLGDARCQEMTCFDGLKVRTAVWPSLFPAPKGTVCILQGRSEFIEKYYEVVQDLRQRGFAVVTMDWRGQGGSERLLPDPLKGHVRRFSDYGADLLQFLREVALPDGPPPHFALAHSMGGLILLSNLPQMRTMLERTMISAPLVQLAREQRIFVGSSMQQSTIRNIASLQRWLGRGRAYMIGVHRTILEPTGFEGNPLTSDGPRYDRTRRLLTDFPELGIAGPTAQWVHESCKAMDKLQSSDLQSRIHIPTLIVTASLDTIVSSKAAEYFASTTRAVKAIGLPGSRHEIMMERDILRKQFWGAFDSFIPGQSEELRAGAL